jgi:hypothetical protein
MTMTFLVEPRRRNRLGDDRTRRHRATPAVVIAAHGGLLSELSCVSSFHVSQRILMDRTHLG